LTKEAVWLVNVAGPAVGPSAWGATLAAARTALEHARTLLSQEPDLAGTALAQQTQRSQAQLEADAKDWKLLAVFDQVRLEQSQIDAQRQDFQFAVAYPRLQKALAEYGLAIRGGEAKEAAARLWQRPATVQPHLKAVLEECWALVPAEEVGQKRWLAAVLAVDADPWLQQFRRAVAQGAWAEVEQLARGAEVSRYHPAVLVSLVRSLPTEAGGRVVSLLRRAQQQYPGDLWVNLCLVHALYLSIARRGADRPPGAQLTHRDDPPLDRNASPSGAEELAIVNEMVAFSRVAVALRPGSSSAHDYLGNALSMQGDLAGAIACYRKALQLNPNDSKAQYNLAKELQIKGDLAGAIAHYQKALELDPQDADAQTNLGTALSKQGDLKGAIACYQKAVALNPNYVLAHYNLGKALKDQGDLKGAIASYQKALQLDPKFAPAHLNLGLALAAQGNLSGAIACYRKALDLDPKSARAHTNLGATLAALGDLAGAIPCFHKAIALDPKSAKAHTGLGFVLYAQKDMAGAITSCKKALALDPTLARAHLVLGLALGDQGDVAAAIACFKKAVTLDPKDPEAYGPLGLALLAQGAFHEARAALQKAVDLRPAGHYLRPVFTRQVQECQRLLDLDARLPALLKGEDQPKDTAEQLALADLCQRYKKCYTAAVRFYADAFAAGAAQSSQRAYNADCAATLAAAGQGVDAAQLDAKEKTRLRQQALAWLKKALTILDKLVEDPERRKEIRQKLHHWQQDPDLTSVRDADALTKLPEAEHAAWQQLWAEVETLLQKAAP
jgi:tetratricopeptide (TPR) repeat protein